MDHLWNVYIVQCADQTLYTGVAKDVDARVCQHNDGRGAKYTRGRRPVALVYSEPAADRSAALRREHAIKKMPTVKKFGLITTSSGK
jgi:putative endonuclease